MKCVTLAVAMLVLACAANDATTTTATTTPATTTTSRTTTSTTAGSAATTAGQTPPSSPAAGPDVRLPVLPASRVGAAAAAPGTLEVEGRCLYLRTSTGTRMLLLFATFDTRWNRAAGVLAVENASYRPGETVTVGGGSPNGMPANVTWVQPPDPSCRADRVWVVHSISRGTR